LEVTDLFIVSSNEIVAASTDLGNIVVTSQAWCFHLLRSYLGAGGFRMVAVDWKLCGKLFIPQDQ